MLSWIQFLLISNFPQTDTENIRMNNKRVEFMPKVVGKLSFGKKRELGTTFGMNAKGVWMILSSKSLL